jgi:DNA-binding NarL/FixJ family response regulator
MDSIRLLIVEQHPGFLQIVVRFLLEHAGQQLTIAGATSDLQAALRLACECQPRVVVIGIDRNTQAALDLVGALRAMSPELVIIVTAQLAIAEYRRAALAAGADCLLGNEILHRDLIPTIADLAMQKEEL